MVKYADFYILVFVVQTAAYGNEFSHKAYLNFITTYHIFQTSYTTIKLLCVCLLFSPSMVTVHHHFREMIGLWSLVHYWLERQPYFYLVGCFFLLSLYIDHQLLPLNTGSAQHRWNFQTTFCSPVLLKTTVTSPAHHLLPCFFDCQAQAIHAHSQFHSTAWTGKTKVSLCWCAHIEIFIRVIWI